ncbi:hypothetical protein [Bosea sp. 2RAB26]|uniref:DprA-like winged helix domain-containing protein n=1 Tax=Bosea sp. 2RAB26 TaxID=3237476 RepID=UPI003F907461
MQGCWTAARARSARRADQGSEYLWDELDLPEISPAPRTVLPPAIAGSDLAPPSEAAGEAEGEGGGDEIRARVLALLGAAPVSLDDLIRASGRSARDVGRLLIELELDGAILRHPGGALSRVMP